MNLKSLLIAVVGWLALAGVGHAALVQHWKLDEATGTTTATATVGSNGTYANSSRTTGVGPGGSITTLQDFNGTTDTVTISPASPAAADAWSVSLWFKTDVSGSGRLIGQSSATTGQIRIESNTVIRVTDTGAGNQDFTVPALGTSTTHHLLVTRSAGNPKNVRVFIDGTESSSGIITAGSGMTWNRIGVSNSVFFNGLLGYVKIFDSDESANVATLYAEGVTAGGSTGDLMLLLSRGSLARPYQPTDIDWRCSPFDAFFGALAP